MTTYVVLDVSDGRADDVSYDVNSIDVKASWRRKDRVVQTLLVLRHEKIWSHSTSTGRTVPGILRKPRHPSPGHSHQHLHELCFQESFHGILLICCVKLVRVLRIHKTICPTGYAKSVQGLEDCVLCVQMVSCCAVLNCVLSAGHRRDSLLNPPADPRPFGQIFLNLYLWCKILAFALFFSSGSWHQLGGVRFRTGPPHQSADLLQKEQRVSQVLCKVRKVVRVCEAAETKGKTVLSCHLCGPVFTDRFSSSWPLQLAPWGSVLLKNSFEFSKEPSSTQLICTVSQNFSFSGVASRSHLQVSYIDVCSLASRFFYRRTFYPFASRICL